MGVNLRSIIKAKEITLVDLKGKAISIDAYNALYQFLAIIRQPDGTPLKDNQGRVTSHLSGLLYRTVNLVENSIKPVYVFDGKPPELKAIEIERRKAVKEEAVKKYEEALARGDFEAARMYAQATSVLTENMVNQAKRLLDLMGIPYVQAPSEGEAQAAYMAKKGDVFACGSQDYDSLLFGAPRLVRNISITGRRKLPRKNVYIEVKPELIALDEVLSDLNISREQLIDIAILVGTDYNPEGIKGIGPKKALTLIKQYGSLENALKHIPGASFPVDPAEIKKIFLKPQVTDNYEVKWRQPDIEGVVNFLCGEHDFSESRVRKAMEKLDKAMKETKTRTSLDMWFKK